MVEALVAFSRKPCVSALNVRSYGAWEVSTLDGETLYYNNETKETLRRCPFLLDSGGCPRTSRMKC